MKNTKALVLYIENGNKRILSVRNYGCLLDFGVFLKEYYFNNNIEFLFDLNSLNKYNINEIFNIDYKDAIKENNYDLIYFLEGSKIFVNTLSSFVPKISVENYIDVDLLEAIERVCLKHLFRRYYKDIKANETLLNSDFISEDCKYLKLLRLVNEAHDNGYKYPTDKLNRWLGYIQGVLIAYGILNVNEERDYSRPLLHSFHLESINSF